MLALRLALLEFLLLIVCAYGSAGVCAQIGECVNIDQTPDLSDETVLLQTKRTLALGEERAQPTFPLSVKGSQNATEHEKTVSMVGDPEYDWTKVDWNDPAFVPNDANIFEKVCKSVTMDYDEAVKKVKFAQEDLAKRQQNDYMLRVKHWGYEHDLAAASVGNNPDAQGPLFAKIKEVAKNRKEMLDNLELAKTELKKAEVKRNKAQFCQEHGWKKGELMESPDGSKWDLWKGGFSSPASSSSTGEDEFDTEFYRSFAREAAVRAAKQQVSEDLLTVIPVDGGPKCPAGTKDYQWPDCKDVFKDNGNQCGSADDACGAAKPCWGEGNPDCEAQVESA